MTVRAKLLLAVAPLALSLVGVGALAIFGVSTLGRSSESILEQNYQSVLAAQEMKAALERLDREAALRLAGQVEDPAEAATSAELERFEAELRRQERHVYESAERGPTELLRGLWPRYRAALSRFDTSQDLEGARQVYVADLAPLSRRIADAANRLVAVNQSAMVAKSDRARASAARMGRVTTAAVLLSLGVGGSLCLLLVSGVLNRLASLSEAVERMDAGDFDVRLRLRGHDEIARLARRFDELAAHLDDYRRSSSGELLQAHSASQAAIDSIPDPIVVFGAKGYTLRANQAARTLLAVEPPDSSRDPFAAADPAVRLALQRARDHVLATHEPYVPSGFAEAVHVGGHDGERELLPRATPVRTSSNEVVGATVILQDVTEPRRFDELKNDLIAMVAHELRTPLTSLRMAVLLCLERASESLADRGLLVTASEECERLIATVDRLLDLARIQSGRIDLVRRRVDAVALIDASVAAAAGAARARRVELVSVLPGEAIALDVDPEHFKMALANLLQNAIRHSPEGAVVRIAATPVDERVRFSVEDFGEGIEESHQARLFERFYRVPGTGAPGVGLGLAIAREIVLAHGGEIGVRSRIGEGSEFWFTVPRSPGPSN